MVVTIIIEGILLGALLALFCAVGIRKGAVNMVFLYHPDVQDRCVKNGLITKEKIKRNRRLFKGLGIPVYFTRCASRELNRIILKACSYEPEKRYPNAEALYEDLKDIKKE